MIETLRPRQFFDRSSGLAYRRILDIFEEKDRQIAGVPNPIRLVRRFAILGQPPRELLNGYFRGH